MSSLQPLWPDYLLGNGCKMPAIGFGTFRIRDRNTIMTVVDAALKAGYRSFDTAAVYGNESYIGEALNVYLPKHGLTREDIFVTSKLSNSDHNSELSVIDGFKRSKSLLGLVPDLYLIHFPGSSRMDPSDGRNKVLRHVAWGAMVELYKCGRIDSIGVSNFTIRHLQELRQEFPKHVPVINQVEWHPMYYDDELLKYCNENSIQLQGYHSLGGTSNSVSVLKIPALQQIAEKHSVSPARVLLTWSLQRGVGVIPKSVNPKHIMDNFNLNFQLSEDEMNTLNNISPEKVKFAWDPTPVS